MSHVHFFDILSCLTLTPVWNSCLRCREITHFKNAAGFLINSPLVFLSEERCNNKSESPNSSIKAPIVFLSVLDPSVPWHRMLRHVLIPARWTAVQFIQQPEWIALLAFTVSYKQNSLRKYQSSTILHKMTYRIFQTKRCTPPKFWRKRGMCLTVLM